MEKLIRRHDVNMTNVPEPLNVGVYNVFKIIFFDSELIILAFSIKKISILLTRLSNSY